MSDELKVGDSILYTEFKFSLRTGGFEDVNYKGKIMGLFDKDGERWAKIQWLGSTLGLDEKPLSKLRPADRW